MGYDGEEERSRAGERGAGLGRPRYWLVGHPAPYGEVAQNGLDLTNGNRLDSHLGIVADHWHAGGVPRFTPFPALRYADRQIDDLIAPPYDVLSPIDVDALNNRHRFNITHVDVPRESDGAGRYDQAGRVL